MGTRWQGPFVLGPHAAWGPTQHRWTDVFVLGGELEDADGRLPSGTFLTRTPGRHIHAGPRGAALLVYESDADLATDATSLPQARTWERGSTEGLRVARILQHPHLLMLVAWAPDTRVDVHVHPKGEELFVIQGELRQGAERYLAGGWWRMGAGEGHAPFAPIATVALLRNGHLGG